MGIGAQRGVLAVVGLGTAVVLAGCGSGDAGSGHGGSAQGSEPPSPSAAASSTSPASSASSVSPTAAPSVSRPAAASRSVPPAGARRTDDGSDVAACFDGRCEVRVTGQPTRIPVDDRFGVGSLEVTSITARSVVVQASGGGVFLSTSVGEGGTGSLNGLSFRVAELHDGQAVLDFFPKK
ncbi:hypothetical protein ACFC09_07255 [Streptomyces sp. NPDC056161]|uniref:hypothetical protein n=1 Tax=Streptomyces sp. NPDC056161 TaxID=3345732 RepID=UPI0035DF1786